MNCKLTVLMAVYNGGRYLRMAIESILEQTYSDFRFLIVDDASTDDSREIIHSYTDKRIHLLCHDQNVGQTAALNRGLRHVTTTWIARMDSDDYSSPTRLEKQVRVLESDPSLACVGTYGWAFIDDPDVVEAVRVLPQSDGDIKRALLTSLPLIHGSLVVKREVLVGIGGYDERYRYAADMELYERLLRDHRAVNIPEPLLGMRRHSGKNSAKCEALDENIRISRRRLANDRYSDQERKVLRITLSKAYLHRARMRQGNCLAFTDYAWALWFNPRLMLAVMGRILPGFSREISR